MAKRNGSFPESVQPGIPNLFPTPEGWNCAPLGKYLREIKRPVKMTDDAEYKLVTVKRSRGGAEERGLMRGRDIKVKSQFYVKADDFLISKRQIVHGACAIVPQELDGAIVSNEYAVLGANNDFDLEFLKHISNTVYFQQTCFHSSIGVHVEKMIFKLNKWLKWDFNVPPLPEQKKITQILSTWDRAIETADKLVENSQQQKKALMQQLLAEKNCECLRLGKFCLKVGSGVTPKGGSSIYKQSGIPLIRSQNVLWGNIDMSDIVYIDENEHKKMSNSMVRKNDVLLNITGASIGRACVMPDIQAEANVNQHVCIIRTKESLSPTFLCEYILSYYGQMQVEKFQAGGNRQGLNFQQIRSFRIPNIPLQEQEYIAKVISASNETIKLYSRMAINLRKQKQALLQQLLSGKRRVKINETRSPA